MSVPIGSIIAYAGEIDVRGAGRDVGVWENNNGWLLCDGRLLSADPTGGFWDLFGAIGFAWGAAKDRRHFNIPNLQGYFLRGVDLSRDHVVDPDCNARKNPYGGNTGAKVGSFQSFATALPNATARAADPEDPGDANNPASPKFWTSHAGGHTHYLPFELNALRDVNGQNNTVAYPGPGMRTDPVEGDHEHDIRGGNRETRPVNAYVHWIIRYKLMPPLSGPGGMLV